MQVNVFTRNLKFNGHCSGHADISRRIIFYELHHSILIIIKNLARNILQEFHVYLEMNCQCKINKTK